jgi:ribosomal protein L22
MIKIRENPNYEQELKEAEEKERKEKFEALHFNNFSNDQNPDNFVELMIKDKPYDAIYEEITLKEKEAPFTVFHTVKPPRPYVTGTYGNIKGSVKKLKPTVRKIIGLHLYDAMAEMEITQKRAAGPIFKALNMVRNHALGAGMNQDHLWVKEAVLQKHKRRKGLYYHAMGRSGLMKRDWSRVLIKLEEKAPEDIFKMYIEGSVPKGLASLWRKQFYENDFDLETVRKFQFILTAKGRQQRREMIKRKTHMIQDQFLVRWILKAGKRSGD